MSYLNKDMSPYYNPFELKKKNNEILSIDQGLSPGCISCKDGTWWCLYVGHRCNLDCIYCPQGTAEDKRNAIDHPQAMQRLWMDDIKYALKMVAPGTIKGIGYSGGEPLMFIDKILNMASFIEDNFIHEHNSIYQWVYTNGMLVNKDRLQRLHDAGLYEIRFHLGATNFDPEIVKRVKLACDIFRRVTVETPANPKFKEWAIDKNGLKILQDFGVTQVNSTEQYFHTERSYEEYPDTETYIHTSMARGGHVSPTFSRRITYDIIEYVIQENIDIIINDCNQLSRDAQIMTRELNTNRLKEMY